MKPIILLIALFFSFNLWAQVGIGTTDPIATLDVTGNPENISEIDGIVAPRISGDQLKAKDASYTANQNGVIVYVTSTPDIPLSAKTINVTRPGYYYFYEGEWICMDSENEIGDIKHGLQGTDHNGWIRLNGRAISSLTATQQSNATGLGLSINLPDAEKAFLTTVTGNSLGAVSGSNTKTISQQNLPNVNFNGTSSTDGNHNHYLPIAENTGTVWGVLKGGQGGYTEGGHNRISDSNGSHSHTVSVSSGGSGTALDITPKIMSVNTFIYLGEL